MPVRLRRVLEVEAVRTAAWAQAKLHEWDEFKNFRKHPLSICWGHLYHYVQDASAMPIILMHEALNSREGSDSAPDFAEYLHFLFFSTLGRTLQLRGARDPIGLGVRSNRQWLNKALGMLEGVAHTCGSILTRGEVPADR